MYNRLLAYYEKHPATCTAVMSFLVMLCASLPVYVSGGGFYIDGDYCSQYIPFFIETRRMLESGELWWSWNGAFGNNFIGSYSYYTLFNPFSLIVLLFPASCTATAMYAVTLLKYAVGAYIAFHYIRLFVNNPLATIGSMLYVYSSAILSITHYYNFVDAAFLYPLILLSIERYMMCGKSDYGAISLSFFISAISQYYLTVGTVIGVVIYCVVRIFSADWQMLRRRRWMGLVVRSVIGVVMASYVMLPAYSALVGGVREAVPLTMGTTTVITRLTSLFIPIDARNHSLIPWGGEFPPSCYLPVMCVTFVIAYVVKYYKSWLSVLLCIFLLALSIPHLSAIFTLYTNPTYSRWLYQPALMMSLASVIYMARSGFRTQLARVLLCITAGITLTIIAGVVLLMQLYAHSALPLHLQAWCNHIIQDMSSPLYTAPGVAVITLTILQLVLLLVYMYVRRNNKYMGKRYLLLFIAISGMAMYGSYYRIYNYDVVKCTQESVNRECASTMTHRAVYSNGKIENVGFYSSRFVPHHYHSIPNKELAILKTSGVIRGVWVDNRDDAYKAFASVKEILCDNNNIPYPGEIVAIQDYPHYIPMGFTYDSYLPQDSAIKWYREQQSNESLFHLMLATLVVPDDVIEELPPTLIGYQVPDTLPSVEELARARRMMTCNDFEGTSGGFTADIDLPQDNIVFFSVPCDAGFTVKVNGVEQEPIKVNLSFMGVRCEAGHNYIDAQYRTPLLCEGIILSIVALLLLLITIYTECRSVLGHK